MVQFEEHPSKLAVLLSSQISVPFKSPSPHIGVQTDKLPFVFEQSYPASFWHVLEHPSPYTKFPSSHYSLGGSSLLFPHFEQFEGLPVQFHPEKTWQLEEQPSSSNKFPSSQSSPKSLFPSPQIFKQGRPGVQLYTRIQISRPSVWVKYVSLFDILPMYSTKVLFENA